MVQTLEKVTWTIYDLEVLPENPAIQYELIAGDLLVTRTPHYRHQHICSRVAAALELWSEKTGLGLTIINPGLIYSEIDSVIPDVVWVSNNRLAQIEDDSGHLTASPELVIEVLSSGKENERRDKETKLKLYSIQGVQEYWIIDRFKRQMEVYRREQNQLTLTATLMDQDEIYSTLLPEFSCRVSFLLGEKTGKF
jgi:Uma2 family endonuclease